jgi:hypothetical protein
MFMLYSGSEHVMPCLHYQIDFILFLEFNATFSNISAISWRPVLVVEEAGVPGENHRTVQHSLSAQVQLN